MGAFAALAVPYVWMSVESNKDDEDKYKEGKPEPPPPFEEGDLVEDPYSSKWKYTGSH